MKLKYDYGTQNVSIDGDNRLIATIEHVQEQGHSKSYYLVRMNNMKPHMNIDQQLEALYLKSAGFNSIQDALKYIKGAC